MITIVIPFHSDVERLPATLGILAKSLKDYPIGEVIFACNGPKPVSAELQKLIVSAHSQFRVVHTPAVGIGAGYRHGIKHASSSYVLLSASDLPFGFSDIESALATGRLRSGGQVIFFASKLHRDSVVSRVSKSRSLFTWCLYFLRVALFGPRVPRDCQGTVLVPKGLALDLLASIPDDDYLFTFKLSALALMGRHEVLEIPVRFMEDEQYPSNIRPLKTGLIFLVKILRFRIQTIVRGKS